MENLSNSYELALNELLLILEQLESTTISVDDILEKTQRARVLIEFCRNRLRQIEEDTQQLL